MTNQEMLARHFELVYDIVERNLDGMTHEQSLARPAAGGNCANWILGHLVNVHNGLMEVLGEDPVWESEQLGLARRFAGAPGVIKGPGQTEAEAEAAGAAE